MNVGSARAKRTLLRWNISKNRKNVSKMDPCCRPWKLFKNNNVPISSKLSFAYAKEIAKAAGIRLIGGSREHAVHSLPCAPKT